MSPDSIGARVAALVSTLKATIAPPSASDESDIPAPVASRANGAPTRTGYAWVNGLRMYYEVHGEGGISPILLLHGASSTIGTNFGRLLPLLKASHEQVIALEFQAHGHTRDVDRAFSFEQDADDVAALLEHLRVEKATMFGFGNGGTTALQVAIRHPEVVDRLVVASATYRKDGLQHAYWDAMKRDTFSDMPQPYKDAYLKLNPSQDALFTMYERDSRRMISFEDVPDALIQTIAAPTFVVAGDRDVVRPEHAFDLSRLVPNSRLCILPGGHGEYLGEILYPQVGEHIPRLFVALVNEFLASPAR
jgi:pimeloyl-ACP methyl ester carboxylesterase